MPPILRLVRIGNVGVSFAGTIVGGLAAAGLGLPFSFSLWWAVVLAAFSTACVTAAGNVLNDVLDVDTDRTNHPDRPLVRGEFTIVGARRLTVALFVVGGLFIVPVVMAHPLLAAIFL
ncbi:MAG: UbiA family prenyltransferase, partial [Thermoplasmata archaeon]